MIVVLVTLPFCRGCDADHRDNLGAPPGGWWGGPGGWGSGGPPAGDLASRALALFAHDTTLRRTALASAAGLVATAFVFFRPPYGRPPRAPTDVIGA